MRVPPFLAIGMLGAAVAIFVALWQRAGPSHKLHARPRGLLGDGEKQLHARLVEAFPGRHVFVKVGLGALLAASLTDRARLRNRMADFVVCDAGHEVLMAIQLDEGDGYDRHAVGESIVDLLAAAHYPVREFSRVPSVAELRAALPELIVKA